MTMDANRYHWRAADGSGCHPLGQGTTCNGYMTSKGAKAAGIAAGNQTPRMALDSAIVTGRHYTEPKESAMSKRKEPTLTPKRQKASSSIALAELMFDSPESSTIKSGSYNIVSEMMTIHFGTGKTYDYDHFPLKLWKEFHKAKSKGTYFSLVIRPVYAGRLRG